MPGLISSIWSVFHPQAGSSLPGALVIVNDNCYVVLSPQDLLVLEEQEVWDDSPLTVHFRFLFVDWYFSKLAFAFNVKDYFFYAFLFGLAFLSLSHPHTSEEIPTCFSLMILYLVKLVAILLKKNLKCCVIFCRELFLPRIRAKMITPKYYLCIFSVIFYI